MRVALVVPEFPPDTIGGGGVVFHAIATELRKRHEVLVFTGSNSNRSWIKGGESDMVDGIAIRRYPLVPIAAGTPYLRSVVPPNPLSFRCLWGDLKIWKPDVGHLHGYGYMFIDAAAAVLERLKIPYVATNHGVPRTPQARSRPFRASYALYKRFGPDRTFRRAVSVSGISHAAAADMVGLSADVHVVQNGLTPLVASPEVRPDLSRIAQRPPGQATRVIAAAGRLAWNKGFDVLLLALNEVQVRPLRCIIAGADAGEAVRLQRLADRLDDGVSVSFVGPLDRGALARLFRESDVVVVPSRDEPFGLVALEAIGMGRRVVASDVGGLRDFVAPPLGTRVEAGCPTALAREITEALRNPVPDGDARCQARNVVESRAWSAVALRYENILSAAVLAPSSDFADSPQTGEGCLPSATSR